MTFVSVIVCTYNRSSSIIDTLKSIDSLILSKNIEIEVLIVDNNSKDDTKVVVENYINNGHSKFRYLMEPTRGKAYALNLGIFESKGEIIAFTDDDAIVHENWINNIVKTFNDMKPDCVGGKVLPIWLGKRPKWLTNKFIHVLALQDLGDSTHEINFNHKLEMLYGVNVAYSKEFFNLFGQYNTHLCSRGGAGNEDHEMFKRVIKNNRKAVYNPDIIVFHKVFPERLKKSYFRKWHYLNGKDLAKLDDVESKSVFNIPGHIIKKILLEILQLAISMFKIDKEETFYHELRLTLFFGYVKCRATLQSLKKQ
jgi:glucosyl-dolichyl phosphate glucuronosyltransferase